MSNVREGWQNCDKEALAITVDLWMTACIDDVDVLDKLKSAHHEIIKVQTPNDFDALLKLEQVYHICVEVAEKHRVKKGLPQLYNPVQQVADMIENLFCELIRHGEIRGEEQRWHIEELAKQVINLILNPEKEQDHE